MSADILLLHKAIIANMEQIIESINEKITCWQIRRFFSPQECVTSYHPLCSEIEIINIVIKIAIEAIFNNHFLSLQKKKLAVEFILNITFDNKAKAHSWQIYSKSKAVKFCRKISNSIM